MTILQSKPRCFNHFSGTDTPRTSLDVFCLSIDDRSHLLKVRKPAALRQIVSVGNTIARHRALATDIASLRHESILLYPAIGVGLNTTGPMKNQAKTALSPFDEPAPGSVNGSDFGFQYRFPLTGSGIRFRKHQR